MKGALIHPKGCVRLLRNEKIKPRSPNGELKHSDLPKGISEKA